MMKPHRYTEEEITKVYVNGSNNFPKGKLRNGRFQFFNERDVITHQIDYINGEMNGLQKNWLGSCSRQCLIKNLSNEGESIIIIR